MQTACATGVPFVGMGLQPEQTWHVRACERRGNAIAVSPKDVGRPEFLDAVRRVLDDPQIRIATDEGARGLSRRRRGGRLGAVDRAGDLPGRVSRRGVKPGIRSLNPGSGVHAGDE